MKREKGFTLIELMVVVIILGILAAIALPRLVEQQKKGKENACWADIDEMKTALTLYYLDQDVFPSSLSMLKTCTLIGCPYMDFRRGFGTGDKPKTPWVKPTNNTLYEYAVWTAPENDDGFSIYVGDSYATARPAVYKPNPGMRFSTPAQEE